MYDNDHFIESKSYFFKSIFHSIHDRPLLEMDYIKD